MAKMLKWEPVVEKTVVKLRSVFAELHKIWEETGFSEEVQTAYCEQAYEHIKDLLHDMIAESEQRKEALLKSVEQLMEQISKLCKELKTDLTISGYEKLPLNEVERSLRNDVQKLQYLKEERLARLRKLLEREQSVCKALGMQQMDTVPDLPSEKDLDHFELYIKKQEEERNHLEKIFSDTRQSIVRMMDELGMRPSLNFEHLVYSNPESFVLTSNNMAKLSELHEQLKVQTEEAKQQVEEMKQDLISLWKNLDEPEYACQEFLQSCYGHSTTTRNTLSAEIKRCKEKRRENIAKYVNQLRNEIENLWNLCKYGETQRKAFTPFNSHTYTEDLLTLHELEVERLRRFYDTNKPIFVLLEERDTLWMKMQELLQRANDPDRFHNRGGQLLIEEKERKTITKKLPQIEERLKYLIKEYEDTHGEAFTVNGMLVEEFLTKSWVSLNTGKQSLKKTKKEVKDRSVKKPSSTTKRTPNTLNVLGVSHKVTALSNSKRKLLCTPSPNTSRKRRNKTSDKKQITVSGSKIRRSGRISRKVLHFKSETPQKKHSSTSASSPTVDTTYGQFREHLKEREELRSSLLPEQVLKNSTRSNVMKTPVKTPTKPLRTNLSRTQNGTPKSTSTRLAAVPSALPIIF